MVCWLRWGQVYRLAQERHRLRVAPQLVEHGSLVVVEASVVRVQAQDAGTILQRCLIQPAPIHLHQDRLQLVEPIQAALLDAYAKSKEVARNEVAAAEGRANEMVSAYETAKRETQDSK